MNARYRDKCLSVKERQAAAYAAKRVIEKQLDDVARRAQYLWMCAALNAGFTAEDNQLDDEFHFTLDPCCTAENAKCRKYYTKAENGLEQDWKGETVFCNPPYSRGKKGTPGQEAWIKKCFEESQKTDTTCVMLLPARTDTKAFHTYIYGYAEIRFIRGRLKFGGSTNSAPFPSMIVVFKGKDCNGRFDKPKGAAGRV